MQHEAFNVYAAEYDDHFTHTRIGISQRNKVHRLLKPLLVNRKNILELNCGTGEDAALLAKIGCTVVATDGAAGMVAVAKQKNATADKVEIKQVDLRTPEQLPAILSDIVFSNFGGLNCLSPDELKQLAPVLKNRLHENGLAVLVIMGRKCWWERFYFGLKCDKRKHRRMQKRPAVADIGGQTVNTWYYSPQEVVELFSPHFEIKNAQPIGLFVPPSYLEPFFAHKSFLFSILELLDRCFAHGRWLADAADHYFIVLKPCKK